MGRPCRSLPVRHMGCRLPERRRTCAAALGIRAAPCPAMEERANQKCDSETGAAAQLGILACDDLDQIHQ